MFGEIDLQIMDKATRLQLLKQIGENHRQKEELEFADGIPLSDSDIRETVGDLDGFREYQRDRHSDSEALTSDES